jgi:hypothetical protein
LIQLTFSRKQFQLMDEDIMKVMLAWFEGLDKDEGKEDEDTGLGWSELEDEEGGLDMLQIAMDDDPCDLDWLPSEKRKRVQARVPGAHDHPRLNVSTLH